MNLKAIPIIILCACLPFIVLGQAGKPFAIWEDQALNIYKFVRIDASTGAMTEISTLPGVLGFVMGDVTAYDSGKDRYHFVALTSGSIYKLYTIDALSGAVLHNPPLPFIMAGLEYNCTDSMLYALRNNSGMYDIVRIDPATAIPTSVASVVPISGYVTGTFSLNVTSGHYSFRAFGGPTAILLTYDIYSGSLAASNAFPDNVRGHRYSCPDDATYGVFEDSGVYKLEEIDPMTGTHTSVDTLIGVSPSFIGESHSVNTMGYYTFRGLNTSGNFSVFTADLSTAAITASALTTDNAAGFEESACSCTGTTIEEREKPQLLLYPVPVLEELRIRTGMEWEELEIFSSQGSRLARSEKGSGEISIPVQDWPAGIYFIKIRGKKVITEKFVISK